MVYLKVLAGTALAISVLWVVSKPGYDSGLAAVVSLSALVGFFVAADKKQRIPQQRQVVSKSSVGVQAGGDINIGTISRDKHAK
jgi:hypothetical protein